MNRNRTNLTIAFCLILLATLSRIINAKLNIPNLVPIAAIGVFSGAVFNDRRWLAFLVPVLGQLLADVYFAVFTSTQGFYGFAGEIMNYLAIAGAAGLGVLLKNIKPLQSLVHVFAGSTLFFFVSNFGYFLGGWNGYTFGGLIKTYVDAIPFFNNSMMADMLGGVLLFGGYFIIRMVYIKKMNKATI